MHPYAVAPIHYRPIATWRKERTNPSLTVDITQICRIAVPAFERVKKSKWRRNSTLVMAVLDMAIQKKPKHFNPVLDGRVKRGHDSGTKNRR